MARVITDSCISCGTCAASCPVEAISQGDSQYEIDADAYWKVVKEMESVKGKLLQVMYGD